MKTSICFKFAVASVCMPLTAFTAEPPEARGDFLKADGGSAGTVVLSQTPNGVLLKIDAWGLTPGIHAVHLHETGACDMAMAFESAGDHFAPGASHHGYHSVEGPHAGDLPNQMVAADGRMQVELLNEHVSLEGGEAALFDGDGAALVLHEGADDYTSQPAGDSGDRVACAVLEPR